VLHEEGHPPASLFDFVQGITTLARGKAHQDARLELEDGRSDCWNAPQNSPAAQPETGCTAGACRG
jgi:hypothetical protein